MAEGQWTESTWQRLRANVERFGLDRPPPGDGKRQFGRRRYTCPFFAEEALGCPLPREHKPYGCIGFHPAESGVKDGERCGSRTDLLSDREQLDDREPAVNARLVAAWDWDSPTLPIPVALLSIIHIEHDKFPDMHLI